MPRPPGRVVLRSVRDVVGFRRLRLSGRIALSTPTTRPQAPFSTFAAARSSLWEPEIRSWWLTRAFADGPTPLNCAFNIDFQPQASLSALGNDARNAWSEAAAEYWMPLCVKGEVFVCLGARLNKPPGVVGQRVLGLVVGSGK